jgi:hypothetical protein
VKRIVGFGVDEGEARGHARGDSELVEPKLTIFTMHDGMAKHTDFIGASSVGGGIALSSGDSSVGSLLASGEAAVQGQIFKSLADHSQEFIGICDLEFRPFYVNEAGRRLWYWITFWPGLLLPANPVGLSHDREAIDTLAELGVILLTLSLGLEFSLRKLTKRRLVQSFFEQVSEVAQFEMIPRTLDSTGTGVTHDEHQPRARHHACQLHTSA